MSTGSLIGVKGHVEHPERYEPAKPIHGISCPDQANKNGNVRQPFDELAVVHRPNAGNKSQHCGQGRAGKSYRGRCSGALRNWTCAWRRRHWAQVGSKAVLAIDNAAHVVLALGAQPTAAGSAVCRSGLLRVSTAVHPILLFSVIGAATAAGTNTVSYWTGNRSCAEPLTWADDATML